MDIPAAGARKPPAAREISHPILGVPGIISQQPASSVTAGRKVLPRTADYPLRARGVPMKKFVAFALILSFGRLRQPQPAEQVRHEPAAHEYQPAGKARPGQIGLRGRRWFSHQWPALLRGPRGENFLRPPISRRGRLPRRRTSAPFCTVKAERGRIDRGRLPAKHLPLRASCHGSPKRREYGNDPDPRFHEVPRNRVKSMIKMSAMAVAAMTILLPTALAAEWNTGNHPRRRLVDRQRQLGLPRHQPVSGRDRLADAA